MVFLGEISREPLPRHWVFEKSFCDRSEGQEAFWKARDRELDRCRLRKTIDDQVAFSCRVDIRPGV